MPDLHLECKGPSGGPPLLLSEQRPPSRGGRKKTRKFCPLLAFCLASLSPDRPLQHLRFQASSINLTFPQPSRPQTSFPTPSGFSGSFLITLLLPSSGAGGHTPDVRTDVPSLPRAPLPIGLSHVLSAISFCNFITSLSLPGNSLPSTLPGRQQRGRRCWDSGDSQASHLHQDSLGLLGYRPVTRTDRWALAKQGSHF